MMNVDENQENTSHVLPPSFGLLKTIFLLAPTLFFLFAICQTSQANEDKAARSLAPIISLLLDANTQENISQAEAARFLTQATFGPTYADIVRLSQSSSYQNWLNQQYVMPTTKTVDYAGSQNWVSNYPLIIAGAYNSSMLNVMLNAPDQLRQRVAYALSQIFVVSLDVNNGIAERPLFYLDYYDLLAEHAFGNYRDLLEAVTLNDVMGFYLTMRLNAPANTQVGPVNHPAAFFVTSPDENYAREIMQLFSIGLVELNVDGTPKLQNGEPIPSYTQDTVENLARVFTGWNYKSDTSNSFFNLGIPSDTRPMVSFDGFHDKGSKRLLRGLVTPPNRSARQDLEVALDNIFDHPNVGPFISKLLIQHLVTSNPTPEYVARVARIFNDNGRGVRGDLKAVVNTILLDIESRNGHQSLPNLFGKYKEPFIKQLAIWRGMNARRRLNRNLFTPYDDIFLDRLGQFPLRAKSVFNFYQPDFSSGIFRERALVSPVGQLLDTQSLIAITSSHEEYIQRHHDNAENDFANSTTDLLLDTSVWEALIPDDLSSVDDLIDRLDLVFMAGNMSDEMRDILKSVHSGAEYQVTDKWRIVIDLLNIIALSPQYAIQK